jgi:hypothetical protein
MDFTSIIKLSAIALLRTSVVYNSGMQPRYLWLIIAFQLIIAIVLGIYGILSSLHSKALIEWTTSIALQTVGYNIYRSQDLYGPYQKVNENVIPASLLPLSGGAYSYEDQNLIPGKTYYYWLEDLYFDGKSTRHGPIVIVARRGGIFEIVGAIGLAFIASLQIIWIKKASDRLTNMRSGE